MLILSRPAEKVAEDIAKRVRFIYDGISKECGKENKADSKTFVFCVDSFDFVSFSYFQTYFRISDLQVVQRGGLYHETNDRGR